MEFSQYKARSCGLVNSARKRVYLMQASISQSVYEYFNDFFKIAANRMLSIKNNYKNNTKVTLTNSQKQAREFMM